MMSDAIRTLLAALFPPACAVTLTQGTVAQASGWLQLTAMAPAARGPGGAGPSSSIHSRYPRHLTDLPWGALALRMQLMVRTCVCRHATGTRRRFTERRPDVVATSARHTCRLVNALQAIGAARGGNAGARRAARLQWPTRAATRLRLVRAAPIPPMPAVPEVGIDEWAWRRGQRDGTMVVERVTHRVVDLRPDRSAATVAAWRVPYPTMTVVCRDWRDLYAEGIRRGAPAAVPVVDRGQLVHHLRHALEALLIDHRAAWQAAAIGTAPALLPLRSPEPVTRLYQGRRPRSTPGQLRAAATRARRHAPRVAADQAVHTLHAQGMPTAAMARARGISRPPVYAYLRRDPPPRPKRPQWRPAARVLPPSVPSLLRRWRESGADSRPRGRAMQERGEMHSARTVCRVITQRRRARAAGLSPEAQAAPDTRLQGPSAWAGAFALVGPAAQRSREAQGSRDQRGQRDGAIARAHARRHAWLAMVRERRGHALEAWMADASHRGIEALACCARGRQDDLPAIKAGRTLAWSNGVTAGQMPRLQLGKRQGDGRAGLALLRQRVLQAA